MSNNILKEQLETNKLIEKNSFSLNKKRLNKEGRFYRLFFGNGPIKVCVTHKKFQFKKMFRDCLIGSGCSNDNKVIDVARMNQRIIKLGYAKYFYLTGSNMNFSGSINDIPDMFEYVYKKFS